MARRARFFRERRSHEVALQQFSRRATVLDVEKAVKAAVQTKALSKDTLDNAWNTLLLVRKEIGAVGHVDVGSVVETSDQAVFDEVAVEEPGKTSNMSYDNDENDDQDTI